MVGLRPPQAILAYDPSAPCTVSMDDCNGCGFCVTRKTEAVENLIGIGAAHWRGLVA